jgi:hypothetical protein
MRGRQVRVDLYFGFDRRVRKARKADKDGENRLKYPARPAILSKPDATGWRQCCDDTVDHVDDVNRWVVVVKLEPQPRGWQRAVQAGKDALTQQSRMITYLDTAPSDGPHLLLYK